MAVDIKPQKRAFRTDLAFERLQDLLIYEPETGLFRWRIGRRKCRVGSIAGTPLPPHGYLQIGIDRKIYLAHRLAWLYMTGKWPEIDIDHINGERSDNRWINLREATKSQNSGNAKLSITNKSGFKGVCWDKSRGKWIASIAIGGIQFRLGRYDDIEAAAMAYRMAAKKGFGVFARIEYARSDLPSKPEKET